MASWRGFTLWAPPDYGLHSPNRADQRQGHHEIPALPGWASSFLVLVEVGLVMVRPVTGSPQLPGRATLGLLRLHTQTANTDARRTPRRGVSCRLGVERHVWTPSAFVVKFAAMASVAWTSAICSAHHQQRAQSGADERESHAKRIRGEGDAERLAVHRPPVPEEVRQHETVALYTCAAMTAKTPPSR